MLVGINQSHINQGNHWFRRLYAECKQISPHIRFKRIKFGFWRIYWRQAYLHEVYQDMPMVGHDFDDLDPRFENQKYYEEYEDRAELTRKIKNYREGYYDAINTIRMRVYLMRNNKEFNENAGRAYKIMRVV